MWFDPIIKTRQELLIYFEDLLLAEGVKAAVRDLEVIFEADRWSNWYQGLSTISLPYFSYSAQKMLKYKTLAM